MSPFPVACVPGDRVLYQGRCWVIARLGPGERVYLDDDGDRVIAMAWQMAWVEDRHCWRLHTEGAPLDNDEEDTWKAC